LSLYTLAKRIEVSLFDRVPLNSLLVEHMHGTRKVSVVQQPAQLAFKWDGIESLNGLPIRRISVDDQNMNSRAAQAFSAGH
jgi:hypothetical protein